jgi:transposase-like protein
LRVEFARAGKEKHFDGLKIVIAGQRAAASYADVARELGISEAAAKAAAHRLRRRYRDLLREEMAQTVAELGDMVDEIRGLLSTLAS